MSMRDEVNDQKKKLKNMTRKEKFSYFWDYYKVHTIVTLLVVIVGGIFIHDAVTAKGYAFSSILLNSYGSGSQEEFQQDFAEYAAIDLDTYECFIDITSTLSYETMSQMDLAISQKITALSQTEGLDILISDSDPFNNFAKGMLFLDLREELSEEEYARYEPYFYYVDAAELDNEELTYDESGMPVVVDNHKDHSDPSSMTDPIPVGIYLVNSEKLKQWDCYTAAGEPPILGFVYSSPNKSAAHLFLQYLTEE